MLLDKQNMFSDNQTLSGALGGAPVSTNVIDLGSTANNIGVGYPMFVVFLITEAFTDSSSNSTVTPALYTDSDEAFGSATLIRTYPVFAALTAVNTQRAYRLDPETKTGPYERYLRMTYTIANGDLDTGKISCFLAEQVQLEKIYPGGFTIN